MSKRYDLIVFDWDGTVIDSTAVIASSIQAACVDVGVAPPDDARARHVIGLSLDQALRHAAPEVPPHLYSELAARYRYHFLARDQDIPLYQGAYETIIDLFNRGWWLAVATGKSRVGLQRSLEVTGMGPYFHATRTADQTRSKPDPTMLIELMDELGVMPERTLMIGDTTHDLQLAQNAGVDAVAITHGAHPAMQLQALAPLAMVDDFEQLASWLRAHA